MSSSLSSIEPQVAPSPQNFLFVASVLLSLYSAIATVAALAMQDSVEMWVWFASFLPISLFFAVSSFVLHRHKRNARIMHAWLLTTSMLVLYADHISNHLYEVWLLNLMVVVLAVIVGDAAVLGVVCAVLVVSITVTTVCEVSSCEEFDFFASSQEYHVQWNVGWPLLVTRLLFSVLLVVTVRRVTALRASSEQSTNIAMEVVDLLVSHDIDGAYAKLSGEEGVHVSSLYKLIRTLQPVSTEASLFVQVTDTVHQDDFSTAPRTGTLRPKTSWVAGLGIDVGSLSRSARSAGPDNSLSMDVGEETELTVELPRLKTSRATVLLIDLTTNGNHTNESVHVMRGVVTQACAALARHSGDVVEIRANQVLASWNVMKATATHAKSACLAARVLMDVLNGHEFHWWSITLSSGLVDSFATGPLNAQVISGMPVEQVRSMSPLSLTMCCPILVSQITKGLVGDEFLFRAIDVISYAPPSSLTQVGDNANSVLTVYSLTVGMSARDVALFNQGFSHFCSGRYTDALNVFKRFAESVPHDLQAKRIVAMAEGVLDESLCLPNPYMREMLEWENYENKAVFGESKWRETPAQEVGLPKLQSVLRADKVERQIRAISTPQSPAPSDSSDSEDSSCMLPLVLRDQRAALYFRSDKVLGVGAHGSVWQGMCSNGTLSALKYIPIPKQQNRTTLPKCDVPSAASSLSSSTATRHIALTVPSPREGAARAMPPPSPRREETNKIVQEIMMLSQLEHENIVSYLGYCMSSTHVTICMECANSGSLAQIATQFRELPDSAVARFTRDITNGLVYLHMKYVVHGDLKPGNVLLLSDGTCKLTDFGTARIGLKTSECLGTPTYMSYEAAMGVITPENDLWALGVTIAELLEGCLPFPQELRGLSQMQFLRKVQKGEAIPITSKLDTASADFVRQCLHRDTDARPKANTMLLHAFLL